MIGRALVAALAAVALIAGLAVAAELPLGPRSLDERRSARELAPGVRFTRIVRGGPEGSRWRIRVLTLDRSRGAGLLSALSNRAVRRRERLTRIARRERGLAAVNGGFFASRGLSDGDPVGALVIGGRLVSESVDGRPALIVPSDASRPAAVARLGFRGRATVGGASRGLDGVNRPAGFIPGCGGRGGDRPTERPDSSVMCTDRSELVLMTRDFGRRTPRRRGVVELEVRGGAAVALHSGGEVQIPREGAVLSGIGDAARLLREKGERGASVAVHADLLRGRRPLDVAAVDALVSGDPVLVRRGRVRVRRGGARAARTLAGVRRDGRILLVTVDGRSRRSVGVTLREAARLLRSLGARDGFALDGGGSTTITVGRRVANRPSDGRQRLLGDALVVPR